MGYDTFAFCMDCHTYQELFKNYGGVSEIKSEEDEKVVIAEIEDNIHVAARWLSFLDEHRAHEVQILKDNTYDFCWDDDGNARLCDSDHKHEEFFKDLDVYTDIGGQPC